jgi:hypothetical protein
LFCISLFVLLFFFLFGHCIVCSPTHGLVWFMMFIATFNTILVISWRSVVLVDETGVPGERQRPVASHCIEYTLP